MSTQAPDSPPSRIDFECLPQSFCSGREFVEAWARHAGLDDAETGLVVLGCDEVFSNLSRHAYRKMCGAHPVSCHARIEDGRLWFRIVHCGEGLTDAEYEKFRQPPSCGERVGGLGLHVIGQVFDRVNHRKEDGKCVIELSLPIVDRLSGGR